MLTRAARLFHTVRYLRPVQIYGRATHVLRRLRPRLGPAPAVRPSAQAWPLPRWRAPSMLGPDCFRFLNEEHGLDDPADWNNPAWSRLWLYNLHYFDDLDAVGGDSRAAWHEAWIARWIAENPPLGGPGWEPYCLSLRIVNWCLYAWSGGRLSDEALASLAVQLRTLERTVETHLLGNHLIANAKALIFGGLFFQGKEADAWVKLGVQYLRRELGEQILSDGGHFERSPMYHAVIAGDVIDLLAADQIIVGALPRDLVGELTDLAPKMISWAELMSHGDGDLAFFNDAAMGIAPPPATLRVRATELGLKLPPQKVGSGVHCLPASGYLRLEVGPAALLVDVAAVGPDYIPGHAHADTLSCELSIGNQRVLVNQGTSGYADCAERLAERGTAAHNTVLVDGQNSSEVWGSFRVARRARPFGIEAFAGPRSLRAKASHDGYCRLPGRVRHTRSWELSEDALIVTDELSGRFRTAHAHWRLHPGFSATKLNDGRLHIATEGTVLELETLGGVVEVLETYWAPEFGLREAAHMLRVTFTSERLISTWRWR